MQDEIFHVPQTQQYCSGAWWVWDDKITTLPGLYGISACIYHVISRIPFLSTLSCSLNFLRFINLVLGVACVPLMNSLLMALHPGKSSKEIRLMVGAMVLAQLWTLLGIKIQ